MSFRVTKNFQITSAKQVPYVPPVLPVGILIDKYWNATSLLLQGDTTNNGNVLDSSTNNLTITPTGTPAQGNFSPFFGLSGSELFNGSTDYLSVANSSDLDLNSTFTLECWFYRTVTGNMCLFGRGGGAGSWSATNGGQYLLFIEGGILQWQWNINGSNAQIQVSAPALNQWHHIVVGYNGTTTRVWLNGSSIGTSNSGYVLPTTRNLTYVGQLQSTGYLFNGYISNLRIVKGTDVYGVGNASITVPTSPLTAITNTKLLLKFENGKFLDGTRVRNITAVGTPTISNSTFKYGTGAILFNGTTDYLSLENSTQLDQVGDFTQEMWIYKTGTGGLTGDIMFIKNVTNYLYIWFDHTTNKLSCNKHNIGTICTGTAVLSNNIWYHITLTRAGSTVRVFVNGVLDSSGTAAGDTSGTAITYVGGFPGGYSFKGYIDDLRITNGAARYTASFTPPQTVLPSNGATGGTVTFSGADVIHTFASSGTFSSTTPITASYLIAAGGGGGGSGVTNTSHGGGGGAGGLLTGSVSVSVGTNSVVVGGGGSTDTNGSNSSFKSFTSIGGGKGGRAPSSGTGAGGSGGSGGGGSSDIFGGTNAGGAGTAGQGKNGGLGAANATGPGGGGGAGTAGGTVLAGSGSMSNISGTSVFYCGGGGAGGQPGGPGGGGGSGGGAGSPGTANTGGGGGGAASQGFAGGTGGSGVVIVRYTSNS